MAREAGNERVAELLKNPRSAKSRAPAVFLDDLVDAVEEGRLDFVKMLVDHGVDLNAPDEDGLPALVRAADRGETEMVKALIAAGAALDVRDREYGATALMEAANEGHAEIVRLLLEAGADVNLGARGDPGGEAAGWTALMGAAMAGNAEIVQALLRVGADPSIVNAKGETALDLARQARQGNKARVIQLLGGGGG
jgi:ankyrin repeat protein